MWYYVIHNFLNLNKKSLIGRGNKRLAYEAFISRQRNSQPQDST